MKKTYINPSIELTIVKNNVIATSLYDEVGEGEILKSEDLFFDFEAGADLL